MHRVKKIPRTGFCVKVQDPRLTQLLCSSILGICFLKNQITLLPQVSLLPAVVVVVLYTHTRISLQQAYSLLHDTCTATMVCVSTHIDFDEIKRYAEVSFYH
jgi:energy-converting hydrogenase Eha subunit C